MPSSPLPLAPHLTLIIPIHYQNSSGASYNSEKTSMRNKIDAGRAGCLVICLIIVLFNTMSHAHVHYDPDGNSVNWYPKSCCGNGDCQPATQVRQVGAGVWLQTADGSTLFVDSLQPRRRSHDLRWHICTRYDSDAQTLILHCVFEPGDAV